eukprot:TRINITY_DN2687_c0_g1::TRINITY_DN2687_c0_g1_i1::g.26145::m.26145 TRINITY_DN2687_c0_g1::TRINITY_DN2687_c0_g1_i1::g.26145  ORF type:complete len:142 (+),score=27.37,RGS/PF00615.14/2.7e-13 TRINITY_DN2687_c0_g1_i1:511-936(+)
MKRLSRDNAVLATFIDDYDHRAPFLESFSSDRQKEGLFRLYLDIQGFRNISNRNTLRVRAETIYAKYFGPESTYRLPIPQDCLDTLATCLEDEGSSLRPSLFQPVFEHVEANLQRIFAEFLDSDLYQRYLISLTLPPDLSS